MVMQRHNKKVGLDNHSGPPSIYSREDTDGDTPLLCLKPGWWLPQVPPLSERIRHIHQQHATSCGLACVAMVADVTYQTVLKRTNELGVLKRDGYFGTISRDLIAVLKSFDIRAVRRTGFKSWLDVPQVTIVGVNPSGPHWVVAVRSQTDYYIYDPGTVMPYALRRDFGRIHLMGDGLEIVSAPGFNRLPKRKLWKPPKLAG
jgi:ABC-type bacteriocin/lantibiotic exporter with double-glycine peptidase domain